jgi:hypothetical protein
MAIMMGIKGCLEFSTFLSITLSLNGVNANFLIILFQCSQVLTSFGELSLLHTLSNIPLNKINCCKNKVKL